jgi:hypothetical protein
MNSPLALIPLIKTAWLRVMIYLLALMIVACVVLASFIVGAHKGNFNVSGIRELMTGSNRAVIVLIFFILTVLITYIFRRWIDRKTFISLGLELKDHTRDLISGASLALFIMCSSCLIIQATGHLKWMDFIFDPKFQFLAFGTIGLTALYEELIFRGYVLGNLLESFPKWLSLIISALLFMAFHWNATGFFPLVNTLILGLITGMFYLYAQNLWFSICFHWAWKYMAGPILGFGDESSTQSLLQSSLLGDENITGGAAGLQGSLILTAVSLLCLVALYFTLQKKLNPKSQPVQGQI